MLLLLLSCFVFDVGCCLLVVIVDVVVVESPRVLMQLFFKLNYLFLVCY